jgi:hypothetical protein
MSDTMTKTIIVHILTIDHKHGTETRVFRSADGARRALADWARRYYFEVMEGRESYCLDEVELED